MGRKIALFVGAIVLIGILFFFIGLVPYKTNVQVGTVESGSEDIVATVGSEEISQEQFVKELKSLYGKEVLNDYINQKVIFKAAEKYGIKVEKAEVEREYRKLLIGYETEGDFTSYLKEQMGWNKEQLMKNIEFYILWEELATKDVVIPEVDLKAYYNEHQDEFNEPASAHMAQIIVKNQDEAKQVIEEIKAGSDFNTLAQEKSIDLLTASKGGDIGFVSLEELNLSSKVIDELKNIQVGEISQPHQVEEGYAIFKVLEKKEAVTYSFDQIKGEIRRELALNQTNALQQVLDQLKKEMNVQILDPSLR